MSDGCQLNKRTNIITARRSNIHKQKKANPFLANTIVIKIIACELTIALILNDLSRIIPVYYC